MNQHYVHNKARHFRYEKTMRPFHGSLRRATIALTGLSTPPVSEEQFLDLIRDEYPRYYAQIEWVKATLEPDLDVARWTTSIDTEWAAHCDQLFVAKSKLIDELFLDVEQQARIAKRRADAE